MYVPEQHRFGVFYTLLIQRCIEVCKLLLFVEFCELVVSVFWLKTDRLLAGKSSFCTNKTEPQITDTPKLSLVK